MKVLLFVLFAGYAVRCDDKNYYVIEMREDTIQKPFKVYWNVPTKQCKSKKIPFYHLYEKYGIIQNENDAFIGNQVTILYDPGLFPALLKNETSGRFKFRNGGVPQEGDLSKHLKAFKDEVDLSIPDEGFNGIGIIDFESWRPTYRQNFGVLRPYQDVSFEIERNQHWWWQKKWLQAEAKRRFEESARTFMQTTIALAKQLRPRAKWGFYGFPYCFNMASNNMVEACASNVPQENDNISWLWRESTALYPSVYSSVDLSTRQMTSLIRGRVKEAARFGKQILPYFWYRYRDAGFLSEVDLEAALSTLYKSNASGFIIWGSSNDVNTVDKCTQLLNYIEQVMGPAIAKYTKARRLQDDTGDITNTTTDSSSLAVEKDSTDASSTVSNTTDSTNKIKDLDPEYHWVPPENYTQAIKDHVEEEINKKLTNYTETDNTVLDNNVLIDLILNSLINNVSNSQENTTKSDEVNSTTKIVNNDAASDFMSSTSTEGAHNLEVELSSTRSYTEKDKYKDATNLDVTSTVSTKSFEATTSYDDRYKATSDTTDSFIMRFTEYDTTSILPDSFTNSLDTSKSKNLKKNSFQDSMEGFFDMSSTETTETSTSQIEIVDNIEINTSKHIDHTTENGHYYSKEAITTEIATPQTKPIEAMTISLRDENNSQEITKTIEREVLTTTDSYQILNADDIAEKYSSTTELVNAVPTEPNRNTKSLYIKENNESMEPDSKENKTIDSLSTQAPDLNKNTDFKVTTDAQIEDTSLSTVTSSPEQVVYI